MKKIKLEIEHADYIRWMEAALAWNVDRPGAPDDYALTLVRWIASVCDRAATDVLAAAESEAVSARPEPADRPPATVLRLVPDDEGDES